MKLYNTLSRKKEKLIPIKKNKIGLYACGPTVYGYAHIGNFRTYLFEDILRRALEYNGYKVKHIVNITDVGHLTSDADTGEDKMEKGAKREKKSVWDIAEYYTNSFKEDALKINIKKPSSLVRATDYIDEQIKIILKLEKKGFTYLIDDGVYFDTSKIEDYGKLWGSKKTKLRAGARVKMSKGKKGITDFALWKLTPPSTERQMEWDSPWGRGFPGWHTECVVMAKSKLGMPFDIHCGGIDHIQIHHTNEIAQAEAAYNKNLSNFWLHCEFLNLKDKKMSKSADNIIRVKTIEEKGFNPLAFRYLCLGTHYRSKMFFSWEVMECAENGLNSLYKEIKNLKSGKISKQKTNKRKKEFLNLINDDLGTPKILAFLRKVLKDRELSIYDKHYLMLDFDKVLGLNLDKIKKNVISQEIKEIIEKREKYRKNREWAKADKARKKLEKLGYNAIDSRC